MKTLTDIKQDMSELYDALKAGEVDIKIAGELANISGKFLKAEQLELAKDIFMSNRSRTLTIENKEC
jgi:hypothetical protein